MSFGARIVTVVNNFYLRNVSQALFPSIASHFAQSKPRRAMEEVIQLITTPVLGILVYARGAWLMDYPEMTLAVKKLLTRKKNKTSSEKST
jgi:O-antigen/teichoic acid export membrane protein